MEKERFLSLKGNHSCGSAFYHAVSHLLAGKNIHQPDGGYPERNGISDKNVTFSHYRQLLVEKWDLTRR